MKRVLWIIILAAAVVSLGVFAGRWSVETPNRTVEIVYDLPGLLELSEVSETDLGDLFSDLKTAGVTTIAVEPESLGQRMLQGKPIPLEVHEHLPKELVDLARFLPLPIGFEREHFELVQQAGLKIAPKLNTVPWDVSPLWSEYDPELLIVSGQGIMESERLRGSQATVALVEFNAPELSAVDASNIVRLHGISAREMLVLSDERILNRYVRAVKERNLRVLYVRPFVDDDQSWQRSLNLLSSLEMRLEDAGFELGTAVPFAAWNPSLFWTGIVGAGIWAAAILFAVGLFPTWTKVWYGGGLLAYLASLALLLVYPDLAKQGLALVAAIVFPCLSVQLMWGKTSWKQYWGIALVSLLGALFVVATLTGTEYLVKVQEFRGVKLMHVVPIAVVVFALARPLKDWLTKDVPVRYLILLGSLGMLGVLYIVRTGNFGMPVLNVEVQAREFLENVLRVRPRTKEFLVGHPALYFALLSKQPQKSWWLPIAVIGQISLVNTFTHTHTFLGISLLRTLYGLLFGYVIGWLVTKLYVWGRKRWLESDRGLRLLRIR